MSSYKAQFEVLSNRIKELSERHKLSCILSGLRDEICLSWFAFGLTKIQEENLLNNKKTTKPWVDMPKPSILGPPPAFKNDKNDVKTTKLPIQRLTAAQIEEKRKKGMCFYCEEKWHASHQCKVPRIFLMEGLQEFNSGIQLQEFNSGVQL